jgi:predicted small lipoprotein YifL
MIMNRLALFVAAAFMALTLTGCGEQGGGNKTPVGSNQPAPNQPAGTTPTQNP